MWDWRSRSCWFKSNLKHRLFDLFIDKTNSYIGLLSIFKGGQLLFLAMKNARVVNRTAVKLALNDKFYLLISVFFKFSLFFKYVQGLEFYSFKNIINNYITGVSVMFMTMLQVYIIVFTVLKAGIASKSFLPSLESLFFNYWWLEREVSEMTGLIFFNKLDQRNLLLEYFNTFNPLDQSFPTYGYFEVFYNLVYGYLMHGSLSLQI